MNYVFFRLIIYKKKYFFFIFGLWLLPEKFSFCLKNDGFARVWGAEAPWLVCLCKWDLNDVTVVTGCAVVATLCNDDWQSWWDWKTEMKFWPPVDLKPLKIWNQNWRVSRKLNICFSCDSLLSGDQNCLMCFFILIVNLCNILLICVL